VADVAQVALGVLGLRDADEHRLVALGVDLQAHVADDAAVDEPVAAVEVDVEVVGHDRGARRAELVAVGRHEPVAVLVAVGLEQRDAAGGDGRRDERARESGDEPGHFDPL
jgi:hypothetical protein